MNVRQFYQDSNKISLLFAVFMAFMVVPAVEQGLWFWVAWDVVFCVFNVYAAIPGYARDQLKFWR
jgi:hypothetical protein